MFQRGPQLFTTFQEVIRRVAVEHGLSLSYDNLDGEVTISCELTGEKRVVVIALGNAVQDVVDAMKALVAHREGFVREYRAAVAPHNDWWTGTE